MSGSDRRPHWHVELVKALYPRYRRASRLQKGRILDELCAATGYHRKYAIHLLHRPPRRRPAKPRGRPPLYDSTLDRLLAGAWLALGQPGSTRLDSERDRWLPWLQRRFGLDGEQMRSLATMSRRTMDRRLKPFRQRLRRWEEDPRVQRPVLSPSARMAQVQAVASGPVTPAGPTAPKLRRGGQSARIRPVNPSSGADQASAKPRGGAASPTLRRREPMEIRTRKQQGVMIISVEGAMVLTNESFPIMKKVVQELKGGEKRFVIDLGKVEKMDSAGVGELVAVNVAVKEKEGKVHLANFHENIGKILQMALIHKLIPTYDTQKEAIAAFDQGGGEAAS